MAIEGLTYSEIEDRIARNLLGIEYKSGTASGNGSTTTLVDASLRGGDDTHNGKWVLFTSGTNSGSERQATDFVNSTGTLTFAPAASAGTATNDTYKLFDHRFNSTLIRSAVNDAITAAIGRYYKREESVALHSAQRIARFDIPSEFDMISRIQYRRQVRGISVHACDVTFDETTDADFTQSVDVEENMGGRSLKLTVALAASAGDYISDSISSLDLSKYTHLEFWVKSSTALTAADYKIHLDNGTVQADGTDLESLSVPAVSADTWTFCRVALAAPESDTAIVSIGIEMDQDKGAHVVYFEDFRAVDDNSAEWVTLNDECWRIDQEALDLVFTPPGVIAMGDSLIKITGGSNPAQLTAQSTVATVPESYLIAYATGSLLLGGSRATGDDRDGRRSLGREWMDRAVRERGKFPILINVRKVG